MDKTTRLYNQTVKAALEQVESLVKTAFKYDPRLTDFVLAMGSYTFYAKRAGIIDDSDFEKYPAIIPTFKFLDEWDEYLKLSGSGIWLKSNGEKLTDW